MDDFSVVRFYGLSAKSKPWTNFTSIQRKILERLRNVVAVEWSAMRLTGRDASFPSEAPRGPSLPPPSGSLPPGSSELISPQWVGSGVPAPSNSRI
jgi:hypothetical protein